MNGKRLQELREKNGLSRATLAEMAYTTESFIQGWEQGWAIHLPSSGEIEAMAECFHMSEEKLLTALDIDEDELDDETPTSWIDFIDAGVRAWKYVKSEIDKK